MGKTGVKRDWASYNDSLVKRGDVTLWFDEATLKEWKTKTRSVKRGRPQQYSDVCIETLLTIKQAFRLTYRSTEGFARWIFTLLQIDPARVPDYSLLCKRAQTLNVSIKVYGHSKHLRLLIDSTGLKVFGEGEWKVRTHGASKRRTWRKIHIARGTDGQIHAVMTTENSVDDAEAGIALLERVKGRIKTVRADGGYDKRKFYLYASTRGFAVIAPPRKNALFDRDCSFGTAGRYRNIAINYRHVGHFNWWEQIYRYHLRSLVETEMYRLKQITGERLQTRVLKRREHETDVRVNILNKYAFVTRSLQK